MKPSPDGAAATAATAAQQQLYDRVYLAVEKLLQDSPGCHDFSHVRRVIRNAELILAGEPAAAPFPVRLGALLHDVARPEELASGGRVCHAALGAQKAALVLRQAGCGDEGLIALVAEIVRTHRYRGADRPATLEAMLVYDADKLDSLGAFGIARAFHFAGRIGAALHNTETAALASVAYSEQDTAYREYLVKLRTLPDRMLTETGRAIARDRAAFMRDFFDRLNAESV